VGNAAFIFSHEATGSSDTVTVVRAFGDFQKQEVLLIGDPAGTSTPVTAFTSSAVSNVQGSMAAGLATALCALDATRAQATATIALRDCFELIDGLLESPGVS
jgi:hypothetical protein